MRSEVGDLGACTRFPRLARTMTEATDSAATARLEQQVKALEADRDYWRVGATALLRHVRKGRTKASPWLIALLERRPPKLVAVALADKFCAYSLATDDVGGSTIAH